MHLKAGKRYSAKKWLHAEAKFKNNIFLRMNIWSNENKAERLIIEIFQN